MTTQLIAQYPIDLPTDYDMSIIKERIRTRGSALDGRVGLVAKAYCVREFGIDGSTSNQYAPFYLWDNINAAADFFWRRAGFEGIVRDFGRPSVKTWLPQTVMFGAAPPNAVEYASVQVSPVSADVDLLSLAADLRERTVEQAASANVHLAVAGIDPATWTVVKFASSVEPLVGHGLVYRVLHVSQPT